MILVKRCVKSRKKFEKKIVENKPIIAAFGDFPCDLYECDGYYLGLPHGFSPVPPRGFVPVFVGTEVANVIKVAGENFIKTMESLNKAHKKVDIIRLFLRGDFHPYGNEYTYQIVPVEMAPMCSGYVKDVVMPMIQRFSSVLESEGDKDRLIDVQGKTIKDGKGVARDIKSLSLPFDVFYNGEEFYLI